MANINSPTWPVSASTFVVAVAIVRELDDFIDIVFFVHVARDAHG